MCTNSDQAPDEAPPSLPPLDGRRPQSWTLDGYPIVDGKYHDLVTDEIKTHMGSLQGGSPSISVYWHNRRATGRSKQFYAIAKTSKCEVTEYLIRFGKILETGSCTISSLNATTYAVNVVVLTELSTNVFSELLRDHKL